MALDEEIRWARQLAAAHDEQRREERRQRAAEQAELKSALAEAVERLRPFEGKRLRRYEVCKSWFGRIAASATAVGGGGGLCRSSDAG